MIYISNILDWMNPHKANNLITKLCEMKSGSFLIFRQLNNQKDYEKLLYPTFTYLKDESEKFASHSRSMFYEKISVFKRI